MTTSTIGHDAEARPIEIDIAKLTETNLGIIGNPGSGKSRTIRKVLELAVGGPQRIVLDVEDEFYTLREQVPSMLIAGGLKGDCPALVENAEGLARFLLETGIDAVIQLNDLGIDGQRLFIARFCEALISAPTELWHPALVVIDEAHRFAPNMGVAESSEAVNRLVFQGRKRGFGAVFATTRHARLSTDVRGMLNNWLIGRAAQTVDKKAAADMLGVSVTSPEARALPQLKPGEFWCFGPALTSEPTLTRIGSVVTTHLRPGQRDVPPRPAPEQIRAMLAQLHVEPVPLVPNDASEMPRTVDKAQDRFFTEKAIQAAEQRGYKRGIEEGTAKGRAAAGAEAREAFRNWLATIDPDRIIAAHAPPAALAVEAEPPQSPARHRPEGRRPQRTDRRPAVRRLLDAIHGARPVALTFAAAAARAGISRRSSAYLTYKREVMAAVDEVEITQDGRFRSRMTDPSADPGVPPVELWKGKLPPSYGRMLGAIADGADTRDRIAEIAGVSPTSSGLGAGLRELVSLSLVVADNDRYTLSRELADAGA